MYRGYNRLNTDASSAFFDHDFEIIGPDHNCNTSSAFGMVGNVSQNEQQLMTPDALMFQDDFEILGANGNPDVNGAQMMSTENKKSGTKRKAETEHREENRINTKRAERDAKIHAMLYENPEAVAAHLKDADDDVREAAERLLHGMGEDGALAVVSLLDDFSVWERRDAVELLGEMGQAAWAHAEVIAGLLEDVDFVRLAAVEALIKMGEAGSVPARRALERFVAERR
jgi:hypothetical protein